MTIPRCELLVEVLDTADPATPAGFYRPADDYRYVAVELAFTNPTTTPHRDHPIAMTSAISTQGYVFAPTTTEIAEGAAFGPATFHPGDTRSGWLVFEVPAGIDLAKVQLALDAGFAPDKAQLALGAPGN